MVSHTERGMGGPVHVHYHRERRRRRRLRGRLRELARRRELLKLIDAVVGLALAAVLGVLALLAASGLLAQG